MGSWTRGLKRRLAELAGLAPSQLSDILARRREPTKEQAAALEQATISLNGELPIVGALQWLYPDKYRNPLLREATPCNSEKTE